jgi:DNA-binding NtrC family response regulator
VTGRALVVDDEERWRTVFEGVIVELGLEVDAVASFADARRLLARETYVLALVDAVLGEDGVGTLDCQLLLDLLRRRYPAVPVFATTGKPLHPGEVGGLYRLGVVDMVYKPDIRLSDLRSMLRRAVAGELTGSDLAAPGERAVPPRPREDARMRGHQRQRNPARRWRRLGRRRRVGRTSSSPTRRRTVRGQSGSPGSWSPPATG